jgi:hypothetical protein
MLTLYSRGVVQCRQKNIREAVFVVRSNTKFPGNSEFSFIVIANVAENRLAPAMQAMSFSPLMLRRGQPARTRLAVSMCLTLSDTGRFFAKTAVARCHAGRRI